MRLVWAFALLIYAMGLSAPLSAQTSASDWVVPGRHPFTGTPEQACSIHVAQGNISEANCRAAVAMYKRGECTERQLKDGENLAVTFTVDGQHGAEHKRVAFGSSIPNNDKRRTATECRLPNGEALVLPRVCGNWSVPIARPSSPELKVGQSGLLPRKPIVVQTPGLLVPEYCPPGSDIYLPGTTIFID